MTSPLEAAEDRGAPPPTCAGCGAPLPARDGRADVACAYCGRPARIEAPAPATRPRAAHGLPALPEVLLVFLAITGATVVITLLPSALPGLGGYVHLLVGGVFLITAVKLSQREPGGMRRYGIDLSGLLTPPDADDARPAGPLGIYDLARALRDAARPALREAGFALGLAAVIFPPVVVGFSVYHGPLHPFRWNPPDDLGSFALTQLVVVALPEEALFRGYVQTRLGDRWPQGRFHGAPIDARALMLQAALFALLHFASIPSPARLAVFVPGLLFGWVRAKRGGIGAAMLLHALSNVLAEILERGWLL